MQQIVNIDNDTGKVNKAIHLIQIMEANPEIDIFGIKQEDRHDKSHWHNEKWHINDVEPLTEELSKNYPQFKTGDLLVSLRSANLIFVFDPGNLKIKWWRQGLTRRQHDPDWNNRGTITIFNNNMHRNFSSIAELNPKDFTYHYPIKGSEYDFYSRIWGKHQLTSKDNYLITSSGQGRVFEVDKNGEVVFEFINSYKNNNESMRVAEAKFLPSDFFKNLPQCEK